MILAISYVIVRFLRMSGSGNLYLWVAALLRIGGDLALHTGLGGQVQMLVKYPARGDIGWDFLARGGLRSWLEVGSGSGSCLS
jgi:hypothetical protein